MPSLLHTVSLMTAGWQRAVRQCLLGELFDLSPTQCTWKNRGQQTVASRAQYIQHVCPTGIHRRPP